MTLVTFDARENKSSMQELHVEVGKWMSLASEEFKSERDYKKVISKESDNFIIEN